MAKLCGLASLTAIKKLRLNVPQTNVWYLAACNKAKNDKANDLLIKKGCVTPLQYPARTFLIDDQNNESWIANDHRKNLFLSRTTLSDTTQSHIRAPLSTLVLD